MCKLLFFLCLTGVVEATHTRVLLGDVHALTFKSGEYTAGRRSSPIPQLNCVGGNGRDMAMGRGSLPSVIQCQNQGSDGKDAQWACTAELDDDFRLGVADVTCEGYEYPNDPYVLEGSCGLEFTIELTQKGKIQYEQTLPFYGLLPAIVFWGGIGLVLICGCRYRSREYSSGAYASRGYASGGYAFRRCASRRCASRGRTHRSTGFGGTKRR